MNDIPIRFNGRTWPAGSLLAAIPEPDRDAFLHAGRFREFQTGQALVFEGDRSTYVHLVVDGFVKVTCAAGGGKTALLAIRAGGDLIGELAGLDDEPRSATVTATGAAVTSYMTQSQFRAFLDAHPATSRAVSTTIAAKLRSATRRRIDFSGLDVRTRLARVLIELADRYGVPTKTGTGIDVYATQSELAGMIGASEVAVNRRLSELRAEGIVDTGHGRITIIDVKLLRVRAEFLP